MNNPTTPTPKNKKYLIHVQFDAVEIVVSAKNKREAKKKKYDRINKRPPSAFVDLKNTFIDER